MKKKLFGGVVAIAMATLMVLNVNVSSSKNSHSKLKFGSVTSVMADEPSADPSADLSGSVTCPSADYAPNKMISAVADPPVTLHRVKAGTSLTWYETYVLGFTYNEECSAVTQTKNCVGSAGACCDQNAVGVTVVVSGCSAKKG